MSLRVGIDIGSTTVKVVVLSEQNKLLFRSYERHFVWSTTAWKMEAATSSFRPPWFRMGWMSLLANTPHREAEAVMKKLEDSAGAATLVDTMPPLFTSQAEYDAFLERHNTSSAPSHDINAYMIRASP